MKKHLALCALAAVLLSASISCKKGDTGPAGTNGTNGTNGKDGQNGKDGKNGNANVIELVYGSRTFTGIQAYDFPATVTPGMIDSSIIQVYYNPSTEVSTSWYFCPGLGSGGTYETRCFTYQSQVSPTVITSLSVRLMNPNGSGSYATAVTFTKLRVLIIPASSVTTLTGKGIDLKDYSAVRQAFQLND